MDAVDIGIEMPSDDITLAASAPAPAKSVFLHSSTLTKYIQLESILALIVPAISFTHWLYVSIQRYGLLICPPRSIFSRRTPPVFSLLIPSCLYHPTPRKMGSRHHIGKRYIFVGRRDCRSASVLRHWGSVLFFAYPSGGVTLLILIFYH